MSRPSEIKDTIMEYYDKNAQEFFESTVNLTMQHLYGPFLEYVPKHGRILDAGCGSGRDSLYFKKQGCSITAMDSSKKLVKLASDLLGEDVLLMSFNEIEFCDEFDGIWACASLLHIPKSSMDEVLHRLIRALKVGGVLYASFKYGDGETIERERFFNNYTEESFGQLLNKHPSLHVLKVWKTEDVREDRRGKYWLNILVRKQSQREDKFEEQGNKMVVKTESIEDLINTIENPDQREFAMELLNAVLESYDENMNLRESIAELEDEIQRLKDRKEKMLGADNN